MLLTLAVLAVGLAADAPAPSQVQSSPVAELVTVTLAGIAAIITALAGYGNLRKRRQAEADAVPVTVVAPGDPEDRSSRLRERLTALETRMTITDRRIEDLSEQLQLQRAVAVVTEAAASPRRRRRPEDPPL